MFRLPADPLVLVAEGVGRPGNLGTIVRSTCAAGADALVVADGRTDLFRAETVRGSVGTLFRLALAGSTTAETIAWLRAHDLRIVVATPDADRPCWDVDLGGYAEAIVVGNERHGVAAAWLDAADETVSVPMFAGPADSLNVAVAAGVVLFEAARQRLLAHTESSPRPNSRTGRASPIVRGLRGRGVCRIVPALSAEEPPSEAALLRFQWHRGRG